MKNTKEKRTSFTNKSTEAVPVRAGWAEAALKLAEAGGEELLMGEFDNAKDSDFLSRSEQIRSVRGLEIATNSSTADEADIYQIALELFTSEKDAFNWLRLPHPLLDGETPLVAAKTSSGAQNVKNLLMATKYGGAA